MQPRVVVMRLVILLTSLPFVVGDEGKCWEGHNRSRGRLKDSMESCNNVRTVDKRLKNINLKQNNR